MFETHAFHQLPAQRQNQLTDSAVSFVTQHHGGWDIPDTRKACVIQLDAQTVYCAKSCSGQSERPGKTDYGTDSAIQLFLD